MAKSEGSKQRETKTSLTIKIYDYAELVQHCVCDRGQRNRIEKLYELMKDLENDKSRPFKMVLELRG